MAEAQSVRPGWQRNLSAGAAGESVSNESYASPASHEPIASETGQKQNRPDLVASLAGILDSLDDQPKVLVAAGAIALPLAANVEAKSGEQEITFSLSCWHVSDDLVVINSLPYGQRASRDELELLANILRAIACFPGHLPRVEFIEWPLTPGGDSDFDGAQTQLSMFLQGRHEARPYRWLLAMGEDLALLLTQQAGEGGAALPPEAATLIVIPSLQAMLAEPLSKREAWQAIRSITDGI